MWIALLLALPQSATAADPAHVVPEDPDVPPGMAQIVVEVTGTPGGEIPFDAKQPQLIVGLAQGRQELTALEFGSGGDWDAESAVVDPGEYHLNFTVFGTRIWRSGGWPKLELEPGETEVIQVDLRAQGAFPFTLEQTPCGHRDAWSVTSGQHSFGVTFPGTEPTAGAYLPSFPVDAEGRGWALPPENGQSISGKVHRTTVAADLQPPAAEGERWSVSLEPAAKVITARQGSQLTLTPYGASQPWNGDHASAGPYSHLVARWRTDVPRLAVFVDDERLGVVRPTDLDALEPGCIAVDDLPFIQETKNVEVRIVNGGPVSRQARYPGLEPRAVHAPEWTLLIDPVDRGFDHFDRSWDSSEQFAVVPAGEGASNRYVLGEWAERDGSEWTAAIHIPPGEYHLALREDVGRCTFIRTDPIKIERGSALVPVQFDIAEAKRWVLVARTPRGKTPGYFAARSLLIGAESLYLGSEMAFRPMATGVEAPKDERFDVFWGWGDPPRSARLGGAPGAYGRVVPIRPVRGDDNADFADLLVEVPNPRRLEMKVRPLFGGELAAWTDASVLALEPLGLILANPPRPPKTAFHNGKDTLTVYLAGESARGVLVEATPERRRILRAWFLATKDGISFLGGEEGQTWKPLQITNAGEEMRQVRAWAAGPEGAKFPDAGIALIEPGATVEVMIPPTVGHITWHAVDKWQTPVRPAVGRDSLGKDGVVLIRN